MARERKRESLIISKINKIQICVLTHVQIDIPRCVCTCVRIHNWKCILTAEQGFGFSVFVAYFTAALSRSLSLPLARSHSLWPRDAILHSIRRLLSLPVQIHCCHTCCLILSLSLSLALLLCVKCSQPFLLFCTFSLNIWWLCILIGAQCNVAHE